ncbi:MAG: YicC/YloC family endoribonuclease [Pseudomonadota bacterium]
MSVYSMTGYASVQQSTSASSAAAPRLGLEIRSVNSRFLDLVFRLPEELRHAEPALREKLASRLKRGKVEVRASLDSAQGSHLKDPPPAALQRLSALEDTVKAWLPQAISLSVADVLRLAASDQPPPQDLDTHLAQLAQTALDALLDARAREGDKLVTMLRDRLASLRELAARAGPLVPQLVAQQRARFLERWQETLALAGGGVSAEAAQDRALTEATAFAIRIDVAEEITRLSAHLDEVERLLNKGGELGKRLDFLIQEMHREANTLGSKSAALELTRISVDMKVLIEQMREQVQNIE